MAKIPRSAYTLCLACSVLLNVYFAINLLVSGRQGVPLWNNEVALSWSRSAAEEAELAAAEVCSGHGAAYLDGSRVDGKPICECHACYGGPDCSLFLPGCTVNANGGDPLFLEPYWKKHAEKSAIVVAGWHRMSYAFNDDPYRNFISQELEAHIRKLHAAVGNAVTDGKRIIFGAGSAQLLYAAVHALSSIRNSSSSSSSTSPAMVVATAPYYALYQLQIEYFNSTCCSFQGDTARWKNTTDTSSGNIIEFVTAPNNPDGLLNEAVLHGPSVKTIHDRAYYWPHFTGIPFADDEDLTLFTISKLTGHAGSRFGWALVKDEEVYQRMTTYMAYSTMGVSRDTQLRALKLLKVVLQDGGREFFEFGSKTMAKRWERLRKALSMSARFSLQKNPSEFCTFSKKVREPTPAYAWVKCEREEDKNCLEILNAAKIMGRGGSAFHADDRYVRLSLIRSDDDFNVLIDRLEKLVSEEDGAKIL